MRKNIKNGQEILCVLKGSVRLVHDQDSILLHAGDAVHFFTFPENQRITNEARAVAVVFWVGTL